MSFREIFVVHMQNSVSELCVLLHDSTPKAGRYRPYLTFNGLYTPFSSPHNGGTEGGVKTIEGQKGSSVSYHFTPRK